MKKVGNPEKKPLIDTMKELGQQYGVKVTDLSDRGVRAIGVVGGIKKHGLDSIKGKIKLLACRKLI